jgi:hypothetical protein
VSYLERRVFGGGDFPAHLRRSERWPLSVVVHHHVVDMVVDFLVADPAVKTVRRGAVASQLAGAAAPFRCLDTVRAGCVWVGFGGRFTSPSWAAAVRFRGLGKCIRWQTGQPLRGGGAGRGGGGTPSMIGGGRGWLISSLFPPISLACSRFPVCLWAWFVDHPPSDSFVEWGWSTNREPADGMPRGTPETTSSHRISTPGPVPRPAPGPAPRIVS